MLAALFDGHKDLFVYPGESGFFYKFYPVFDDLKLSDSEKERWAVKAILKALDDILREWVGSDACPGYSFAKLKESFRECLQTGQKKTRDFFTAVIYAAWKTLSQSSEDQKCWVEKTTSVEIYAATLFEWYPEAKFIHLLRDPRDNYAAIKAGWEKEYCHYFDSKERLLQSVIDRGKLGMEFAELNQKRYGRDRYFIVRYEDLVTDPVTTLKKIAGFLNISYQVSLLTPSFCGIPWDGNNFENKKFHSISRGSLGRWKKRITPHEAKVIEHNFRPVMERFGYASCYTEIEAADAATEHYKWFNYAQTYSLKTPASRKRLRRKL